MKNERIRNLLSLCAPLACLALAPAAEPPASRPASPIVAAKASHARVALVAESPTFAPGVPVTVALVFTMDPAWHVYFKDPGESGMPPEVTWTLPGGWTAGELQFPKPEVLKTTAGTNFVYHGEVALLATITPAAGAKVGDAVDVAASVAWLECDADVCLPGKRAVTVTLTAADAANATADATKQFDAYRVKVREAESFDPAGHR